MKKVNGFLFISNSSTLPYLSLNTSHCSKTGYDTVIYVVAGISGWLILGKLSYVGNDK